MQGYGIRAWLGRAVTSQAASLWWLWAPQALAGGQFGAFWLLHPELILAWEFVCRQFAAERMLGSSCPS